MSDLPPRIESNAEILAFPNIYCRDLRANDLCDEELMERIASAFTRVQVLDTEEGERARVIITGILKSLDVIEDSEELIDENRRIKNGAVTIAQQSIYVKRHLLAATRLLQHQATSLSTEMPAQLIEAYGLIGPQWKDTNIYRAVELLDKLIVNNRRDAYTNAIVNARKMGIIMMAHATPGYNANE